MPALGEEVRIDLTAGRMQRRPLDSGTTDLSLAGRGLNSLTLLREVDGRVGPLEPENRLLITAGLLTGTGAPTATRLHVSARSPLTGLLGSSSVGGTVGPALRSNGLQSLRLDGRSPHPVYVVVEDGRVGIRDATALWGLDTEEAARRLGESHGEGSTMLLIGPAGENRVPLACIVTERGHAAGRTGMGAVLGSKRVKAVVVRPTERAAGVPSAVREAVRRYLKSIRSAPNYADKSAHGTSSAVGPANELGLLGTRNYRSGSFEHAAAIDGTRMDDLVERRRGCGGCPVRCKAELRLVSGQYAGEAAERPDFEPIASWGAKTGLDDPEAVIHLHGLCDRLGIDSVSAGNTVAFALDLYDRGILAPADTGGLELSWGDPAAMEALLRQMAASEGIGRLLGRGVRAAAEAIGRGAERYAYHVKGLELTAFDPRGAFASGLGYAVSNRGGDFTSVYARHELVLSPEEAEILYGDPRAADRRSPIGKAAMVRRGLVVCAALDALGVCKIPALTLINAFDLQAEADLSAAILGRPLTAGDLFLAGERIVNAERLLNLELGATAEADTLPAVFLEEPVASASGPFATMPLREMVEEYYTAMGWTSEGVPQPDTLARLGLKDLARR